MIPFRSAVHATRTPSAARASVSHPQLGEAWREHAARIAETPENGTVRGMFFTDIQRSTPGLTTLKRPRYLPFSKYPLREFMQLLLDAAYCVAPSRPPEEGLRLVGRSAYKTFATSIAGVSVLSGATDSCERALQLAPRVYSLIVEPGSVEVVSCGKGEGVVRIRDIWSFPESYNVGAWLGAIEAQGAQGSIDVIRHSWCNVDMHVRWQY